MKTLIVLLLSLLLFGCATTGGDSRKLDGAIVRDRDTGRYYQIEHASGNSYKIHTIVKNRIIRYP